jgi:four helix bundle protein
LADALVLDIYRETRTFPAEERYGLQAQIRRASVSVSSNLVEGSARRGDVEYLNFCNIACASAFETRYLLDLVRLVIALEHETAKKKASPRTP